MENPQGTGVEDTEIDDLTLHLARFFVRVVLIWSQQLYIQLPDEQAVAETRVERVSASYQLQSGSNCILWAVEDGGVRLLSLPGLKDSRIVALMEAKQRFQDLEDGKPVISDGLLAQMAGQALLVLLDKRRRTIFDTSVIKIQATCHYMKFFSFECSPLYLEEFEALSPNDDSTLYFTVSSSDWFDITIEEGREMAVRHILALVEWARDGMRDDDSGKENSGGMDTK